MNTSTTTAAHDHSGGCVVCSYARALPPEKRLWDDDLWLAGPAMEAPGWVMIMTKRHAEGTWALDDAEAASFGIVLRDLMALVKDVTGAPRLHYMVAGEVELHYHTVIVPRLEGQTPLWRTQDLIDRAQELADPEAAAILTGRMQERLRQSATAPAG